MRSPDTRSMVIGLALGLMAGGAAFADTLDTLKMNTLVLTDVAGNARALLIDDAGQFSQTRSDGVSAVGIWAIDETGRFCFTPRGEAGMCLPPFPVDRAVGDEWDVLGPAGALVYRARIVEGRIQLDRTAQDAQPAILQDVGDTGR